VRPTSTSLFVSLDLPGSKCNALVDTGSSVTLLSENMFNRVGRLLQPSSVRILTVDGTEIPVYGSTCLSTRLGMKSFKIQYVVTSHIPYDCIIGLDFLKAVGAHLFLDKMILQLGQIEVPLRCTPEPARTCLVTAVAPFEIKARSFLNVVGLVDQGLAGRSRAPGILDVHPKLGLHLEATLVRPIDNRVHLCIQNDSDEDELVLAGTKLGTFQPLPVRGVTLLSPEASMIDPKDNQLDFDLLAKNSAHLSSTELQQLKATLVKHHKIFSTTLGKTNLLEHVIDTKDSHPVRSAPRRTNPVAKEEIGSQIKKLLEQKVIEPSVSPWASPIVLVKKKTNDWRLCIDYRRLNDVTVKDAHPLPRIDDTLDALQGNTYFTALDLHSGYWQVAMNELDKSKTAFTCPQGLYQFNTMPMGLCNAAATFQRLMQHVLRDLQWKTLVVYLDDVVVFGKTFEEMLTNLATVFERFELAGLTLRFTKCNFAQTSLKILGHIVNAEGISPDPEKVACVQEWAEPTNLKELRSFIGFSSYYRKFIKDFATIAGPLIEATKGFVFGTEQRASFNALKLRLTTAPILSYPVFEHGNFILDCDASDFAMGGVLSQQFDDQERVIAYASKTFSSAEKSYCTTRKELLSVVTFTDKFKCYLQGSHFTIRTDHQSLKFLTSFKEPIGQLARWLEKLQAFDFTIQHRPGKQHVNADSLSRLCPKSSNCPKCVPEAVSVVAALRKQVLVNREDSDAIVAISSPVPAPRKRRPPVTAPPPDLCISESESADSYDRPTIIVPPRSTRKQSSDSEDTEPAVAHGTRTSIPPIDEWPMIQDADDALSFMRTLATRVQKLTRQEIDRLSAEQRMWYSKRTSLQMRDNVLVRVYNNNTVLCAPRQLRKSIISLLHDSIEGGHYGVQKTLDKIKLRFYWPKMRYDVEEHCRTCLPCQKSKPSIKYSKADLIGIGTGFPGQRLGIDIIEFPKSKNGYKYALSMIDYFTRNAEVIPVKDTKAETIAMVIFKEWICRYGVPHILHSDQGRNLDRNAIINALCALFDIDKTRTTPFRPQCNGATERIHRTLTTMLKCFLSSQDLWDELLPGCLLAYRCSINASTLYSPFELLYGRPMTLPVDILVSTPDTTTTHTDFISSLRSQIEMICSLVRSRSAVVQTTSRRTYASTHKTSRTTLRDGQLVWLWAPHKNLGLAGKRKLTQPWTGPYKVLRRLSPVNYELRLDKRKVGGELIVHVDKLKALQVQNPEVADDADESDE
jgi:hypothetical protein